MVSVLLILSGVLVAYITYPIANIITIVDPRTFVESLTRPQVADALLLSLGTATISTLLLRAPWYSTCILHGQIQFSRQVCHKSHNHYTLGYPAIGQWNFALGYIWCILSYRTKSSSRIHSVCHRSGNGSNVCIFTLHDPIRSAAFESVDESYEKVARILGKNRLETFLRVSLPLAKTGIIAGFIMTWVRSVGELGATMMMAYNPHTISIQNL